MKPAHPLISPSSSFCAGVDSGEMEVQRQGEGEDEERWKDRQNSREDEGAQRRTESTIHTVPELLLDSMQVDRQTSAHYYCFTQRNVLLFSC